MARFVKGDVVVVPFPFSDLTPAKRRPALVLTELEGDDVILCQITMQGSSDGYSIPIQADDFDSGGLRHPSIARPNRVIVDSGIIAYKAGCLRTDEVSAVVARAIDILSH